MIEGYEIRDKIDHMVLSEINYHTEWLVGEMGGIGQDGEPIEEDLVHKNDDLTWSQVANASGVNEPLIYTRRSRQLEVASTSRTRIVQ